MAIPFLSLQEWRDEFGSKSESAFDLLVPNLFYVKNDQVYFQLPLDKFDETFELFELDPDLVTDTIELSDVLVQKMEEIDPEIITILLSITLDRLGYSPFQEVGSFGLSFSDFKKYYGENFDRDMKTSYPYYDELVNHLSTMTESS